MRNTQWLRLVALVIALSACASAPATEQPTPVRATPMPNTPIGTPTSRPRRSCPELIGLSALEFDLDKLRTTHELIQAVSGRYPSAGPFKLSPGTSGSVSFGWDTPEGSHFGAYFTESLGRRYISNVSIGGPNQTKASTITDSLLCFGPPDYYLAVNGPERMGNRIPNVDNVQLFYVRLGLVVVGWDESSPSRKPGNLTIADLRRTPSGSLSQVWLSVAQDASESFAADYIRAAVKPWPGGLSDLVFIDRVDLRRQFATPGLGN